MIIIRLAALAMGAASCFAQLTSTVSLNNGVQLTVVASLGQPTDEDVLKVELLPSISGDGFYRLFRDQSKLVVFAYELDVTRAGTDDEFHVTIKPVLGDFAVKYPDADGGKPVPTISEPRELAPLHSGGRAQIGLFEIPGMGLKVTDAIEVSLNKTPAGPSSAQPSGRLRFESLKVYVNHNLVATSGTPGSVTGRYAMFYIPGKGGYFFSTSQVPDRPFVKAGSVDHATLKFTVDNESYECLSASPILTERAEVWVYHDPNYKPGGNLSAAKSNQVASDAFFTSAADSLNWWVPVSK